MNCLIEVPEENEFCGKCGTKMVKKSNNEETMDIIKKAIESERRIWFMIGFVKGMGHEVRDKKYINGLMELWNKEEKETAKHYKELLKFWKEFHEEDIDDFGKVKEELKKEKNKNT